ncbi:MAG: hypothetical protein GY794_06785 [bacterium]|nr:hypothetical protein [bacterium]
MIEDGDMNYQDYSCDVSRLKMGEASDLDIWRYAKLESYSIVTRDADFHEYFLAPIPC